MIMIIKEMMFHLLKCYSSLNEKNRKDMMKILKEFLNSNNQMVKIKLVYCIKKFIVFKRSDFENFFF